MSHINKFNKCITQLLSAEIEIDEEDQAIILLASLLKSYETLVTTLLVGKQTLTVDEVTTALLETEKIKQPTNEDEFADMLLASTNGGSLTNSWILDSGCTYHMCPHKEWFCTYQPCDVGTFLMGNDAICKVIGIGTVKIKMHDGLVRTLGNVRHIPELKKNLISLGTLDSLGYGFSAKGGLLKVCKGSLIVMKGEKAGNLYRLLGELFKVELQLPLIQNPVMTTSIYGTCF
ncbi:hypothetical protein UlMin_033693 [Ulmus minor]